MSNLFLNESNEPNLEKNIFSFSAKDLTIKTDPFVSNKTKKDYSNRNTTKFILGKKLGQGTFATVRLATHIETQEIVAIKILDKLKLKESVKKRFAKEIKILRKVRHRNIVHLYNVISTKKQVYLVMEYVKGKELFSYINEKKKLSEVESCIFYQQIISGLEYLEKLKIVHRDIKPENIIIEGDKNIKIIDFGLSNIYPENNILFSSCGSPCYAPPEMIMGKKYSGSGVDIWSSGIVLYGMLCGYLPFTESEDHKLYKKIIDAKIFYPSFLSDKAKDLLRKILEKDPEKRITIKKIKKHPWFNLTAPKIKKNPIFLPNELITPIDLNIINIMVNYYGYNEPKIKIDLLKNKHNNTTATYYLLLDAKIKKGEKSIADMKSDEYFNYINNPCNFFSYYKNDINKVIKERVYKDLNEEDYIINKIYTYKNSPRNLSLTKNDKIRIKKNNKEKEKEKQKSGEIFDKIENNINNNTIKNTNVDNTKKLESINFHITDIDNKEEFIFSNDNNNNCSINKPTFDIHKIHKKSKNKFNDKIRNRNQPKLTYTNNTLANTTYFHRPIRNKIESLDKNKNNESKKSINNNKLDLKQKTNIFNNIDCIKEKIRILKNLSKKKSNNNSISSLKMNGTKNRNLREKSKYKRVLTDGKNEINQSEDISNIKMKKNSMTIKVNPLINGKKVIYKKLFNKTKGSIDLKLNNNLETSTFLNESKIEPKRSIKIFSESYKKSPIKMSKNQTYKKQEKINGYDISNNKDIKKENNNQKTKHLKINSFKKNNIKKSPNKENISPKIFKQKLFVKLKKRNNNDLSPEKNDEIKLNDYHTELKINIIDTSIYNTNDNFKNFEEQNNYNKLKSIDLKIKNLAKKKRNEKNEEEKRRSGSNKERTIFKPIIQKKNCQK